MRRTIDAIQVFRAAKRTAEAVLKAADAAAAAKKKTGNPTQKKAQAKAVPKSSSQPKPKASGGGKGSGGGGAKANTTKPGGKVVATDPESGETRIETVTAEIKGQGLKHLVKVTLEVSP
ncbi:hypothetical protein [Streptomyces bacillaris]|uniref:hypothetical protein n=1 Tax=Streptomyces bacillaris TaxID=68179 RepID=UPI0036FDCA98